MSVPLSNALAELKQNSDNEKRCACTALVLCFLWTLYGNPHLIYAACALLFSYVYWGMKSDELMLRAQNICNRADSD